MLHVRTIMHHARSQMSKPEQSFSRFIHTPVVEKTSEVLGKTVARPSGIAGAAIAACDGSLRRHAHVIFIIPLQIQL